MKIRAYLSFVLIAGTLLSCWPTSVAFNDSASMNPCLKVFQMDPLEISAPNAPLNYNINLTEAIKNGVQNNTKLMLTSGSKKAQVTITGRIINFAVSAAAIQPGDAAARNRLTVSAQMTILFDCPDANYEQEMKVNSTRFADYDATSDLSTVETTLLDEINQQIVQDVINQLLSNW